MSTMRLPMDHSWRGWLTEASDWGTSAAGIKNGILKPTYHAVAWLKFSGVQLSPEVMHVSNAAKEAKNLMAIGEVPGKVNKILGSVAAVYEDPDLNRIGGLFFSSVDIVSPICDLAEWYHARVASFAPATIALVGQFNLGALFISMVKGTYENICKIGDGISKMYSDDATATPDLNTKIGKREAAEQTKALKEAYTIVLRACIDLIKTIAYVALAAIGLISAFFVTIASAGTYILICSTVATTLTIVGEFTRRALPLPSDSKK